MSIGNKFVVVNYELSYSSDHSQNIFQCPTILFSISMQWWISLIFLEACIILIYSKEISKNLEVRYLKNIENLKLDIHCIWFKVGLQYNNP